MIKIIKILIILSLCVGTLNAETDSKKFVIKPRIINGTQVSQNDDTWRFIVAIKEYNGQYCGGSLISPNWVLTAAHCLVDDDGIPYTPTVNDTVGTGHYNLNSMTNNVVKRFIIHPSFDINTFDSDIALIELDTNVTAVTPIAYDVSHTLSTGTQTKVAGWGNMSMVSNNYPNDLQEALTPIIDFNQCNAAFSYDGELTQNMLCAGYFVSTRDSCQGDSGGPLIVDDTLVGIVSWGENCAEDGYPGIYTKVQNYTNWIEGYVGINEVEAKWVPIMMDNIVIFVPNK